IALRIYGIGKAAQWALGVGTKRENDRAAVPQPIRACHHDPEMLGGNLTDALRPCSGKNRLDGADVEKARRLGKYRACEDDLTLPVEDLEIGKLAQGKARLCRAQDQPAQL